MIWRSFFVSLILSYPVLSGSAFAEESKFIARYNISLVGFSLGKGMLEASMTDTSYTLKISGALTGLVGTISEGRGTGIGQGVFKNKALLTNGFSVSIANEKEKRVIEVSAVEGSIKGVNIDPPFEDRTAAERIPVTAKHKTDVVDPMGALIFPSVVDEPLSDKNCTRTLSIFDGLQRFDVNMSYGGIRKVKTNTYEGDALICSARYIPVAGHKPNRSATKFMVENRDLSAWFIPVSNKKYLIPYRIAIKTTIGMLVLEIERIFER